MTIDKNEVRCTTLRDERSTTSSLSDRSNRAGSEAPSLAQSARDQKQRRIESDLNPHSDSFQPFASPPRTMPDISNLSFSDKASSASDEAKARSGQNTPHHSSAFKYANIQTPGLTSSSGTLRTPSSHSQLSPFTPHTPFTRSTSNPVTPLTSYYGSSSAGGKEGGKVQWSGHEVSQGQDSAEDIGRYLLINDLPRDLDGAYIKKLIGSIAHYKVIIIKNLKTTGSIVVSFYDPREAEKVYRHLHAHSVSFQEGAPRLSLNCMRIDRMVVDQASSTASTNQIKLMSQIAEHGEGWESYWSYQESVVVFEVVGDTAITLANMKNCLKGVGEAQRVQPVGLDGKRFIAEFWDTRDAAEAIKWLNGPLSTDSYITARYISDASQPPLEPRTMRRVTSGPADFTLGSVAAHSRPSNLFRATGESARGDVFGPYARQSTPTSRQNLYDQPSPTEDWLALRNRSSSVRNQEPMIPGQYSSYDLPLHLQAANHRSAELGAIDNLVSQIDLAARVRRDDIPRPGMFSKKAIPPDNRVHPDRIILGQDTRTTVMIKDVPNKLSREELVNILSESVPGGFDFVYLRFDFKNACNVGYAFVNFTSLQALYDFIQARVGKRWNLFSSEKVLQICYADIQGKERLINKFRNSDVMTAPEQWRPQIFYSQGSQKGHPEAFPEPDHPAMRMRGGLSRLPTYGHAPSTLSFDDSAAYDYTTADFDHAYGY